MRDLALNPSNISLRVQLGARVLYRCQGMQHLAVHAEPHTSATISLKQLCCVPPLHAWAWS